MTASDETGSEIRLLIMFSIAQFLYYTREDDSLAQNCVCLSLTESIMPGGSLSIWFLWADIAKAMKNEGLSNQYMQQSEEIYDAEQ